MAERLESVPNTVEIGVWDPSVSPGLAETRLNEALAEARGVFNRLGVTAVFYLEAPVGAGVASFVGFGAVRPGNAHTWGAFRRAALAQIDDMIRRTAADPDENEGDRE